MKLRLLLAGFCDPTKRLLMIFLSVAFLLICSVTEAQHSAGNSDMTVEEKIRSLISQMTLPEKVSLLHGNSKFYVAGIKRLGIPELATSDGPHGVRAEINRHDWGYAGLTNDSATCFPPGTALAATWNPALAYNRGLVL